jgi:hypothetical protein
MRRTTPSTTVVLCGQGTHQCWLPIFSLSSSIGTPCGVDEGKGVEQTHTHSRICQHTPYTSLQTQLQAGQS